MSANLFWRPIKGGVDLEVGAPSSFIEMMERAFHALPITLDSGDSARLEGMKFGTVNKEFSEALEEIIEAIGKHGAIQVYAEY